MLQYLSYEANRPQTEQKVGFATQGKPSGSTSKKTKPKKNTSSQNMTLDCGCVIKPNRPTHLSEDCWRLHPEKKPDNLKTRNTGTAASPDVVAAGHNLSFMAVTHGTMLSGSTDGEHITRDDCILDSGCNTHTFNDVKWFTYVNTRVSVKPIMASNGQHLSVAGVGTVRLPLGDGFVELTNAQFAPKAEVNMISPGLLRRGGVLMDGCNDNLVSTATGLSIGKFQWKSNIATLVLRDEQPLFNFAAITSSSITK
ncbi:hypothetical protein E4U59_001003 [Claviceps monticola]|nr:hypothetical protein E4U59_001003 [Claviceps monticola]